MKLGLPFASLTLALAGCPRPSPLGDGETGTGSEETGGDCQDCGAVEWVVDLAASSSGRASPLDVAVDSAGNVVVVGVFEDSFVIQGQTLQSAGESDAFVLRLSPDGELDWAQAFGAEALDFCRAVSVDADGNVYVTGVLVGDVDLGGGVIPNPDTPAGWFASYTAGGSHRFSQLLAPGEGVVPQDISAHGDGSFAIGGGYGGTPDFGEGPLPAADNLDGFVLSLAPDATTRWVRAYNTTGGGSYDYVPGVALDPSGAVFFSIGTGGALDLGDGPLTEPNDADGVLVALEDDGGLRWAHVLGSSEMDVVGEVAVSGSGDVVVHGSLGGAGADLGNGVEQESLGAYVVSMSSDGEYVWSRVVGPASHSPWGVSGVGATDVAVAGDFNGVIDFGDGPTTDSGNNDVVVARYTATGGHVWSRVFDGTEDGRGNAVSGSPDDHVVAVGDYSGTLEFDEAVLTSAGDSGFVAKLAP